MRKCYKFPLKQIGRQQVQQIINRTSDFAVPATPPRRSSEGEAQYVEPTTTTTNTGKDATLIELLKRGTKVILPIKMFCYLHLEN